MTSTYTEHLFSVQFKKVFGDFQKLDKERRSVYVFTQDKAEEAERLIQNYVNKV
jgi:hypothetical protein